MTNTRIFGHCPMGCGQTLFVGAGGHLTCSWIACPRPDAAAKILEEDEHEHLVDVGATTFSVQHPLRERLDALLLHCDLHEWMRLMDGPPGIPGLYRVRSSNGNWELGEAVPRSAKTSARRDGHSEQ